VKDQAKQSSSSWYQGARLITVQVNLSEVHRCCCLDLSAKVTMSAYWWFDHR
jgi:hypothetical protein